MVRNTNNGDFSDDDEEYKNILSKQTNKQTNDEKIKFIWWEKGNDEIFISARRLNTQTVVYHICTLHYESTLSWVR